MSGLKSRYNRIFQRIGAMLRPARKVEPKADLDEEIGFHLAMSARSIQRDSTLSDEEARRRARLAFGAVERFREETYRQRPKWMLETLLIDGRYTLRGLRRNPLFTFAVLATLALGIGATTAVFSVVDRILFRALPFAHDDRLVSVGLTAPIVPEEFLLGGSYYVWQDNQKPFEALTSETGIAPCDLSEHNPARLNCASVEANFLPTLGIAPLLGRNFLPEEDRPNGPKVALISYSLWKSRYASDAGILNRLIDIDGASTRVIGVLPRDFEMPTLEATDIVLPQALDEAAQRKADPGRVMYAFARLRPGVSSAVAQAELEPLFQYSLKLVPPGFRSEVHLRVRSLRDRQMRDVRLSAWVLLGSVLAVMLIACGNVSSLMLARSKDRERELAVRSALGASRSRLLSQALTEGLSLSLGGSALGWILAEALLHLFVAIAPAGLPFLNQASLDWRIAAFAVALAVVCGLFFGALSALERPHSIVNAARSGSGSGSGRSALLRRTLVVAQIAVSMTLLCASSLLVRSFWNLQRQNLGIHTHSIVTATITLGRERYGTAQKQMQFFKTAQTALRRLPGVSEVAVTDSLPPAGTHRESIFERMTVFGRPKSDIVDGSGGTGGMVAWRWVTSEYFQTLGIPIQKGRGFAPEGEASNQPQMILSRLLADRLFPGENPVGKQVRPSVAGPFFTVVGIAANVKNAGLAGQDEPEYYRLRRNLADDWSDSSVLILKSSLPGQSLAPWVRAEISRIDPTVPIQIETMQQRVSELAEGPRFESSLLGFFAIIGLMMAVIGLYGVTAYMASRRTQEIGVRMALGANRVAILRLIAGEGVKLLIAGAALGVGASLALTQFLKSLLFNVGPRDPATFIGVILLLGSIALLAALIPARRATRVDPVVALRYE